MKKKLKLNELSVQSFVTEVTSKNVTGGADVDIAAVTRYCFTIYDCPILTLPVAVCTYNRSFHVCPTTACSVPIDTCLSAVAL